MQAPNEEAYAALRAELTAVQEKLVALEAKRPTSGGRISASRSKLSNGVLVITLVFAALLASGKISSAAQKTIEALFIDKNGNVGIGTLTPKRPLEVNNALKLSNSSSNTDDGVIGANTSKPGLNVVGINTDNSHRKVALWGAVTQFENQDTNTWIGKNRFSKLQLTMDEAKNKDDGTIGANLFWPGLNVVGVNTDSTYRKIALWGEIIQFDNKGTNIWAGKSTFQNRVDFQAGISVTVPLVTETGIELPKTTLPFRFEVTKSGKSFSLDDYCGDDDGCRVRFFCWKEPQIAAAVAVDLLFFRMADSRGVFILASGPNTNSLGHDINGKNGDLFSYQTAWFQHRVALSVTSPGGKCKITVSEH